MRFADAAAFTTSTTKHTNTSPTTALSIFLPGASKGRVIILLAVFALQGLPWEKEINIRRHRKVVVVPTLDNGEAEMHWSLSSRASHAIRLLTEGNDKVGKLVT